MRPLLVTTEKISIVGLADQLISQDNNIGSYAVFYTLAFEHLNFGNNEKALVYSRKAALISQSNAEAVGAGRYIARALFAPGPIQDIASARSKFDQTLDLARNEKTSLKGGLLTSVYEDWLLAEVYFEACDTATDLLRRMAADLGVIPNGNIAYNYVQKKVMGYAQNTSRCKGHNFSLQGP